MSFSISYQNLNDLINQTSQYIDVSDAQFFPDKIMFLRYTNIPKHFTDNNLHLTSDSQYALTTFIDNTRSYIGEETILTCSTPNILNNFTNFKNITLDTGVYILDTAVSPNGDIYILSYDGIYVYRPTENGNFEQIYYIEQIGYQKILVTHEGKILLIKPFEIRTITYNKQRDYFLTQDREYFSSFFGENELEKVYVQSAVLSRNNGVIIKSKINLRNFLNWVFISGVTVNGRSIATFDFRIPRMSGEMYLNSHNEALISDYRGINLYNIRRFEFIATLIPGGRMKFTIDSCDNIITISSDSIVKIFSPDGKLITSKQIELPTNLDHRIGLLKIHVLPDNHILIVYRIVEDNYNAMVIV